MGHDLHSNRFLLILIFIINLPCTSFSLSFNYTILGSSSSSQQMLTSHGNVSFQPSSIELTWFQSNPQLSAGRIYNNQQLPLWDAATGATASFNCSFVFSIKASNNYSGDGLAFFLLNPSQSGIPDNAKGKWLGLLNSSTSGTTSAGIIAVEFDTFKNSGIDPNSNHIGIDVNSINSAVTQPDLNFTLSSSDQIACWIDYSGSQSLLEVYATNLPTTNKPASPLLSYSIDLTQYLPEDVLVGFSAATGTSAEYHSLLSWSFESTTLPSGSGKGSKVGLIVGLVVSISVVAGLLLLVGLHRRKRRMSNRPLAVMHRPPSHLDKGLPSRDLLSYGPRKFKYRDLRDATNNFGDGQLLGRGGFGPVYRGTLREDGSKVAVKCISQRSAQGEKEFMAEVSIISRIRHKNLVQLKGWCRDKHELLLVYEYLPGGSLDQYLFNSNSDSYRNGLDWGTRYNIVCGLGSALQYLHEQCERVIIHRDIKASNVMLDSHFNAKLGDFGLARQLGEGVQGHTTLVAGTVGYMAPESYSLGRATPESDVYSYGAVLLEVACGRRPIDMSLPTECESKLLDWVWNLHSKGMVIGAADLKLEGAFDEEQLQRTLLVGLACSHPDPKMRPSIRLAVEALRGHVPLPEVPTFKPVAYYGPPPVSIQSLFTTTTSSSAPPISRSSSSAQNSEKALLHSV